MSRDDQICLDASVALAFVFSDEKLHTQAVALFRAFAAQGVTFHAPAMFHYECDSVIRLQVYKKALTPAQAQAARAVIGALPVTVEYDAADRDRAYQIAELYDQPRAYDAAYAAYAESRDLDLVTADVPFFESVNGNKKPKTAPALTFVKLIQ